MTETPASTPDGSGDGRLEDSDIESVPALDPIQPDGDADGTDGDSTDGDSTDSTDGDSTDGDSTDGDSTDSTDGDASDGTDDLHPPVVPK